MNIHTILHIFSLDRSKHMFKPGEKYFFFILFTYRMKKNSEGFQDICFHYPGNPNILSIHTLKKRFSPYLFVLICHINQARNDLLTNPSENIFRILPSV